MLYIFDMGGVVTSTATVLPRMLKILGMSREDFFRVCGCAQGNSSYGDPMVRVEYDKNAFDLLTMCSDGLITSREFWRIFSERSGVSVQTDWWQWLFHPVMNTETVALVKKLRESGNRVVCGTNTIDSHYRNHCERGDYSIFDQTYASNLMGVSKPNPDFWKIILTAEETEPKDAVFIDDKEQNCEAASTLGIKSIVFKSAVQVAEDLGINL